ncbi:MAG: alpha/beta hydrolase [Bacteroidota bacterium]
MKKIVIFLLFIPFACGPRHSATGAGAEPVIHTREVYKSIDTFLLEMDIFYQEAALERENNTAIVFFHGGGWAYGSPGEFYSICERYARMGLITFSVEYRLSVDRGVTPSQTISPIECVMDARSALRWVQANAGRFHLAQDKIVAAGQSAGGQLALSTAMIDDWNEAGDDTTLSTCPDALILFSSNVNTVEGWCDYLLGERRELIWSISPTHHIRAGLPPMIAFHGSEDEQVPKWTAEHFAEEMKKAGNRYELVLFEGRQHYLGAGDSTYSGYCTEEILQQADEFLRRLGMMGGEGE